MLFTGCKPARPRLGQAVGVPRRFGIGSLLAVTAGCAVLFSILRCLGCPPAALAAIGGFFALVGIGQAILFGGKKPRKASMVVGASLFLVGVSVFTVFVLYGPAGLRPEPIGWICSAFVFLGVGTFCGYLAGTLIAGIFLVLDRIERRRDRSGQPEPPLPAEIVEEPSDSAAAVGRNAERVCPTGLRADSASVTQAPRLPRRT